MLTFLLGMATGALACLAGVLICRVVDRIRYERYLSRSHEIDLVHQSYRFYSDSQMARHIEAFHKKGKK